MADEVEDGEDVLAVTAPWAAAELLNEHRRALGGSEHDHDADGGNVDAFVEQVDREQDLDIARRQRPSRTPVVLLADPERAVIPARLKRSARNSQWAMLTPKPRARIALGSPTLLADRGQDLADPQVVAGVDVGQLGGGSSVGSIPASRARNCWTSRPLS